MTDAISTEASEEPEKTASPTGALQNPHFRRLWANNVAYFVAYNALRFVFSWYVLDGLNQAEREQGYVVFAIGLPGIFLVLQAGAWADRLNPRILLIATQAGSMLVFAGTALLIASGRATLGWMLVAAVLAGATSSVGQPVRASLVPAIVGKEHLFGAIALNALAMTTSMILGPVVVRLVGDRFGFDGAFWFLAILLLLGLVFLRSLKVPEATEPPGPRRSVLADTGEALRHVASDPSLRVPEATEPVGPRRSVLADTGEALRHVASDPALRVLFLLLAVAGMTVNPAVMITVQAFIKEELGRNSGDAAQPFAMMGIGIAISSVIVMRKGNMANKGAAFQRAMMVGATMTFLMGLTTEFWQLLPLSFCMGLAGGFYINMNQGLIQSHTPQALMGRVMGLYTMVQLGFMPVGALLLGLIANSIGIGNAISGAAAVAFVTVCATYIKGRELRTLS